MFATVHEMRTAKNTLIEGDPMDPVSTDMITQRLNLDMGKQPIGDGWRILTGNNHTNLWARVAYRYEIEE